VIGLVATFTGGVALALPGIVTHPLYVAAGTAGLVLLAGVALVVRTAGRQSAPASGRTWPLRRRSAPMSKATAPLAQWLQHVVNAGIETTRAIALRSAALVRQPEQRRSLLGWAAGNWLFDAASLWVCLWAYGVVIHPGALLAAYGAANLIGLLPVTPGGLGVIEGALIPALTALGDTSVGPLALGVLTWRAMEFWLPSRSPESPISASAPGCTRGTRPAAPMQT
jgi:uncharacterized membrane protein YbhN (UPF0104 family)